MKQTKLNSQHVSRLNLEIINLCHNLCLPLHFNKFGPKIYTNYQRVALIILFLRSKKSLRNFIKELVETLWVSWLGLKEIPSKSVLNDWLRLFNLNFVRRCLNQIIKSEKPRIMSIDATGIDSWQRSRHYAKRINDPNMPYAKADVLIDSETMLVHDFVLRMKPRHDVIGAKTVFQRLKRKNQGILILGDKGYDSEKIHKLVNNFGNIFYAPVRNKSKKPKGFYRRQARKNGNKLYHRRSTVESFMHSLKSMKNNLQSRLHYMKKREFAWTIITYNLERITQRVNSLLKLLFSNQFWTDPVYQ